jgi:hypothetical protein
VGVAGQIGQHRLRAAEWPLGVDHLSVSLNE